MKPYRHNTVMGCHPFRRSPHTPGPLGHNDAASPDSPYWERWHTPGPLGCHDHADPNVISKNKPRSFPYLDQSDLKALWWRTAAKNIDRYYGVVISALKNEGVTELELVFFAFATIAAESAGFAPINEAPSRFNTSDLTDKSTRFDLYEPDTSAGKRVGNIEDGDGAKYRGRGFIQLTGRDNYRKYGTRIGVDLIKNPELANDDKNAARLLALFIADKKADIYKALRAIPPDYKLARKKVNGGSHGLDDFKTIYIKCMQRYKSNHHLP